MGRIDEYSFPTISHQLDELALHMEILYKAHVSRRKMTNLLAQAHKQIDRYMRKWSKARQQNLIIHLHVLAEAQEKPFFFISNKHEI
jgi:hypothetical protein